MMKRLIAGALFVASVFSSHAHAQSWKQMQWGLNTATSPYQVGVNLAGSWYQVATLTSSGAFSFVFPSYSCASSQWVSASNSGGFLCSQPSFSNISGTISASQLIAPGASTFGAVKSSAAPSNQYATGINTSGVVTYAQPAISGISGASKYADGTTGTGVNATANSFSASNQALFLSGTLTGTGEGPHAFFSADDTAGNSTVGQAISAVRMQHSINSGAAAGNRITLYPILIKSVVAPGSTKALKGYLPFFAKSFFSAGDGGGSGTEMGNAYGGAVQVNLTSGATFYETVQGFEADVSMQTGSSAKYKNAMLLAGVNQDAVKGSTWEAMLSFTREGTSPATWDRAIDFFYPPGSWAFHSGSTLIGSSSAQAIGYGVDFSNLTISTSAFKSPGFNVNGSGATTVASLSSTGAVSGTAGSFSGAVSGTTGTFSGAVSVGSSTVAGLPGSPVSGMMATVTDGTAALAWGATVTGGGSTKYLVWWNGTNWTVMGK